MADIDILVPCTLIILVVAWAVCHMWSRLQERYEKEAHEETLRVQAHTEQIQAQEAARIEQYRLDTYKAIMLRNNE